MSIFGKRRLFCIKNVKVIGDYYLYIRMKAEDVGCGENIFFETMDHKGGERIAWRALANRRRERNKLT